MVWGRQNGNVILTYFSVRPWRDRSCIVTPEIPHHVRVELVVRLAVDVVAVAEPVVLAARRVPRDVLRVVVRVKDRVEVLARVGGLRRHLAASKVRCWA